MIVIKNNDVDRIERVKIETRENLIYVLKNGKYVMDSGAITHTPSIKISNKLEYISENRALKLIREFEELREKSETKWPNPTKILD